MPFDPDAYIKDRIQPTSGFDPDAYISTRLGAPKPEQSPGLLGGSAKAVVDSLPMIGGAVGGVLGTPADAIAGPAGNMAGAAIGGYLGTAAKNLINSHFDPQNAPKTAREVLTQPAVGGVEQGLMQGAGEGVINAAGGGIKAAAESGSKIAKWIGTKLLSSSLGANPNAIKEYAQFADRINSAPTVDALKDISDEFVGKLASDVDAKKLTAEQAQEAYKSLHSDLKDAYKSAGYDARDAVTSAQQTLKDAHNARLQQLSSDVYDTINRLKGEVQSGSGNALDVLNKSNAMIDVSPVKTQIDETIANLKKAGTDDSLAVADKLQAYKDRNFSQGKIAGPDAKKLIQGLDQITKYSPMAGAFDDVKNAAFKDVRSALDQTLKNSVPEYRAAMEPVAANSNLLNRVSDFGDKQRATSLLGNINAPNQMERKAALQELGKKYGADFVNAAKPESLPEYDLLNKAQAAQDALRPDRVAEKIDQSLATSRQKAALDESQASLESSQQKLAPFKSLAPNSAGQTQAQQKLAQLGKGHNVELERMFTELGKLTDTDFVQAMKDNQIKAAFQKGATNGSRNTLMGSLVGSAAGLLLGGGVVGAAEGGSIGGAVGRVVDQWGPAITKKVLDASIRVSKNPAIATIRSLDLPEPIKRNMVVALEDYLSRGESQAGKSIASDALQNVADDKKQPNRSPSKSTGSAAWAQTGLSKLGIKDQDLSNRLLADPKALELLHQASDLPPGSKAIKRIQDQLQKNLGNK